MVALQDDVTLDFDEQNVVQILFIDEEDFPLANLTEHQASDYEFYSDESKLSSEDSSEDEEENGENEVGFYEEEWSREVKHRVDMDIIEETGINVNATNLKSCLDFVYFFFIQEVWHLLVCQTNLYAQQKRGLTESSV